MPVIRVQIDIAAPPATCFDLARSVEAHVESTRGTSEAAVAGVTKGLLTLGDQVTWRARHFGVTQELTSRITACDRPRHFRDEMVHGVFARLVHDHYFEDVARGTRMRDVFDFAAPFGALGTIAERLFLTAYLRQFLERRARTLKHLAESDEGKRILGAGLEPWDSLPFRPN